jgi:rare lipoprotein A
LKGPDPSSIWLNPSFLTDMHAKRNRYFPKFYAFFALAALLLLFAYGCAGKRPPPRPPGHAKPYSINGRWYQPIPHAKDFQERGIASWYGKKFHGRKTANGETYDMYGVSAAHKTLPLGTYVRVKNLNNGRQVDVRINDRGPFVQGRIIDLSYTAAKQIGIIGPGTAKVEITALGSAMPSGSKVAPGVSPAPIDFTKGNFSLQAGAFADRKNAERQKRHLSQRYQNVHISTFDNGDGIIYRVRIGSFSSLSQVRDQEKVLVRDGYTNAFVVAD